MRLGCIDIGSNTTRLLVADCDADGLTPVHQERAFTRIGHELLEHGALREVKIDEVVGVVASQLDSARAHGVSEVRAVATEAIRSASNGAELVGAIADRTGVAIDVLSAQEEARLAFVGVTGTLESAVAGELGVVDVGGGSSELVVGAPSGMVRWWASIAVGSATLTHGVLRGDPPRAREIETARQRIADALAALTVPSPEVAIAVGGSATSLARLAGPILDGPVLRRTLALLTSEPAEAVAARYAIDRRRARLLPAGMLVLAGVAGAFGTELSVGRGGIREGVLLEASAR